MEERIFVQILIALCFGIYVFLKMIMSSEGKLNSAEPKWQVQVCITIE